MDAWGREGALALPPAVSPLLVDHVVFGKERFTEEEIRQVLFATGIAEDRLRAWEKRPGGDTRNPPAR
jgi:hypothetical protein